MSIPYIIEPLDRSHDRAAFTCGVDSLDRYLQQQASQDIHRDLTVVYVLREPQSSTVIGLYTLSASSLEPTDLPENLARRLPRYPTLPAALIGRLALDSRYHGQGLGEHLLLDALHRCLTISEQMGTLAVLVDAKVDAARSFYERYGFQRFRDQPYKLFIPIKTIEESFRD
jgi:GNAT superfamily N-acetyltransferase